MKTNVKDRLIRIALLLGATVLILLILPRADHQRYSYELNQPWRYPLLTADFDMPILRDSASVRMLRDSIDKAYVPIVKRNRQLETQNLTRFSKAISQLVPPADARRLETLLTQVYDRGIVDANIYDRMKRTGSRDLRVAGMDNGAGAVETIDASGMLSPVKAFALVDSLFEAVPTHSSGDSKTKSQVAHALNAVLVPNIIPDTAANNKILSQEYLSVNAALGVIKAGQRIVDRGEIVSPQVFTNLNTYTDMLAKQGGQQDRDTYFIVGQSLYTLICLGGLYVFLMIFRPMFFNSRKKMLFLMCVITAFVMLSILLMEYFSLGVYLMPIAAVPVAILVFFDSRTAIFSLLVTVTLVALAAVYPFHYIFLQLSAGLAAAFTIRTLSQRSQLLRTALVAFVTYSICYVAIRLITDGDLNQFEWRVIGAFGLNSIALSFVYILIVVVEKIFGFTSTVTLVELSDINNQLLRRLAEEAPGTFQHSMQVSTLASEAARAIGANTQLVRTGALYHDIGKLDGPIFFTENQHGINPHTGLNPEVSAHKIISHVTGGLAIAQKAKLPKVIRDFIAEHHGKSVTRYFYNTAVNESDGKEVDKSKFTYPGPNPQSRETAILMMADAVEAASRSLPEYTPEAINNLVDRIIDQQMADGLFNESPISFRDIQTIKTTFKKRLATIYHTRVAYPQLKGAPKAEA